MSNSRTSNIKIICCYNIKLDIKWFHLMKEWYKSVQNSRSYADILLSSSEKILNPPLTAFPMSSPYELNSGDRLRNRQKGATDDLFNERKAKGLCGCCGQEPWKPGHKCKSKNLNASTKQFPGKGKKQVQMVIKGEEQAEEGAEIKRMTMSVMDTVSQSMFVRGGINNHIVKVLVDTGSDYSFVAKTKLEQLNLQPSKSAGETVEIAGGQSPTISECVFVR